ncbi:hypothetical protein CWI85_33435, partial [Streptomyces albidoflavus]
GPTTPPVEEPGEPGGGTPPQVPDDSGRGDGRPGPAGTPSMYRQAIESAPGVAREEEPGPESGESVGPEGSGEG